MAYLFVHRLSLSRYGWHWMRTPSTHLRNDIPSIYSPANITVEPAIVKFNGTLDFPSIYRGPPSPEIDAALSRIGRDVTPTWMTREEMLKAGTTDLRSKVRYPDKIGGGYMVSLESAHQMHCVNLLRKASWLEYYEPTDMSFQDTPEIVRLHLDHCIEMIRQNIMCNADVTMITWYWVQGHTVPYPNFNTRHRCWNFEKIIDWSVEHAVHIDPSEVTRFEDTVDLPTPQRVTS
ncbi:uncharacterized protein BJ212DRAFT_1378144 [Suillus subaureus]|uniref:Uncharacterized protein n=1 Tax=Suillus subaureus TaxID=48587 RepID=A0A9P7JA75_9AGAM|nr:uncharacterized protein BJ212DRAFT_1378144 [Suillus subaureus]KAG1810682.1 hypothetical protein BJ212DRAFT_1378144 [Suillus subaureus]